MNNLPQIEFNIKRDGDIYHANVPHRYNAFVQRMRELLVGDCFAITVDNEIIFNHRSIKNIREKITDKIISSEIAREPYALFSSVFDKYDYSTIVLYMYPDAPWFVYIVYNTDNEVFSVSYYKSAQYINRYG